MRKSCFALMFLLVSCAFAQSDAASSMAGPKDVQQFVSQQFGPGFTVASEFTPLAGDLDGDGSEDVVIVGTAKDPLLNEADFHYKAADPYHSYFGFGDPKVTAQFSAQEDKPLLLLIVHDWRAAAPKAKFVILNLPFQKVSITRLRVKKKVVVAISAEDVTEMTSSIYWAGKSYKWQAAGMD
jgi:hypothetical protein